MLTVMRRLGVLQYVKYRARTGSQLNRRALGNIPFTTAGLSSTLLGRPDDNAHFSLQPAPTGYILIRRGANGSVRRDTGESWLRRAYRVRVSRLAGAIRPLATCARAMCQSRVVFTRRSSIRRRLWLGSRCAIARFESRDCMPSVWRRAFAGSLRSRWTRFGGTMASTRFLLIARP